MSKVEDGGEGEQVTAAAGLPSCTRCLACGQLRVYPGDPIYPGTPVAEISIEEETALKLAGRMYTCYCNNAACRERVAIAAAGLTRRGG